MGLIPFEVKLARFQAAQAHTKQREKRKRNAKACREHRRRRKGRALRTYRRGPKSDAVKRRRWVVYKRRHRRKMKLKANAQLREVLTMARAVLGWKSTGPKGGKLSLKQVAALHAGRDRYHQAKREKKVT